MNEQNSGLVISEEVLAAIAVAATRDVDGVSALVPHTANVKQLLRQGSSQRFVKITGTETELVLELWLRIKANVKIADVATEVQRNVKEAMQTMTGKTVAKVNLRIAGVDF
jgi:uncharacterized alkaline shock family protein YloU